MSETVRSVLPSLRYSIISPHSYSTLSQLPSVTARRCFRAYLALSRALVYRSDRARSARRLLAGHEPSAQLDDCEGSAAVVRGDSPNVGNWQCALKARIISGGGFHPDNWR